MARLFGILHLPVYTFCSTSDNCFLGARPSWPLAAGGTPALPGKPEAIKSVNYFPKQMKDADFFIVSSVSEDVDSTIVGFLGVNDAF